MDDDHWCHINHAIWSEIPAVQIMSTRILKCLTATHWAEELSEQACFDEEVEAQIAAAE